VPFEVLFFVIAFAFSWVIWLAVAAVEGELCGGGGACGPRSSLVSHGLVGTCRSTP
jgi:hypothetical protein